MVDRSWIERFRELLKVRSKASEPDVGQLMFGRLEGETATRLFAAWRIEVTVEVDVPLLDSAGVVDPSGKLTVNQVVVVNARMPISIVRGGRFVCCASCGRVREERGAVCETCRG